MPDASIPTRERAMASIVKTTPHVPDKTTYFITRSFTLSKKTNVKGSDTVSADATPTGLSNPAKTLHPLYVCTGIILVICKIEWITTTKQITKYGTINNSRFNFSFSAFSDKDKTIETINIVTQDAAPAPIHFPIIHPSQNELLSNGDILNNNVIVNNRKNRGLIIVLTSSLLFNIFNQKIDLNKYFKPSSGI